MSKRVPAGMRRGGQGGGKPPETLGLEGVGPLSPGNSNYIAVV